MQRFGFSFCFSLFCNKNVDKRRSKTSLLKLPIICLQTLEHVGSVSHTGHCTGPQSTSSSQVGQLGFVCGFDQFAFVCLFCVFTSCVEYTLHVVLSVLPFPRRKKPWRIVLHKCKYLYFTV